MKARIGPSGKIKQLQNNRDSSMGRYDPSSPAKVLHGSGKH